MPALRAIRIETKLHGETYTAFGAMSGVCHQPMTIAIIAWPPKPCSRKCLSNKRMCIRSGLNVTLLRRQINMNRCYGRRFAVHAGAQPQFDLVFLGMGADGHTASLFPGTAALHDEVHSCAANFVEKLDARRVTLSAAVTNNAAHIIFLVWGEDKPAAQGRARRRPPARAIFISAYPTDAWRFIVVSRPIWRRSTLVISSGHRPQLIKKQRSAS